MLAVASCLAGYSTLGRCVQPAPSGHANMTKSTARTIISGFVNFAISECKSVIVCTLSTVGSGNEKGNHLWARWNALATTPGTGCQMLDSWICPTVQLLTAL